MKHVSVVVGLVLAGCAEPGTALRLSVSSEEPLVALRLSLQPGGDQPAVSYRLPVDGSAPSLPGVVVLRLADTDADVAVFLSGDTSDGRTLTAQGALHCAAQEVCMLSVRLSPPHSPTGASCDDAARCASGFCVTGVCCDQACEGGCGVCAATDGATSDGTCTMRAADVICRSSAGSCDLVDRCDGTNSACPDERASMGTVCRAAVAACDLPEVCDGVAADCPANASTCLPGSYCSATAMCVLAQPNGATCTDSTMCSSAFCAPGGVCCNTACNGACEQCAGGGSKVRGTCGPTSANTLTCRASTGVCDPAELCDGSSSACPTDRKSNLISTLVDLAPNGTGSIASATKEYPTLLVAGCPGVPMPDTVSRAFLTFNALILPIGTMLTGVQLHGCVTSGTANATAYATSFKLPLDKQAYDATTSMPTALPPSSGVVHDELTTLPVGLFTSNVETQLELRGNNESCAILPRSDRVYANGSNSTCGTNVFQLVVSRCSP